MNVWNLTAEKPSVPGADGEALSVSQAAELAAGALNNIPKITVLGEVTGFRGPNARSGHCYFQIKDESAALDCIVWKGAYAKRAFDLRDGLQVQFTGTFDLYKPTGKMSFKASSFTLAGEGLLRQQVAQLAEKLRLEGLMEAERKRRVPVFCTRVAVVTSLSGAVINDVKRTLRRRNPLVEVVCVGAKVQGEGAPAELIEGLRRAAAITPAPDCILLVRGGGSFEDLMTFNDEALARAVAACPVPVVTGIGHEPDNSICDMVSDRRCSTPTAAAESVAPEFSELVHVLDTREQRLQAACSSLVTGAVSESDLARERMERAMRVRLDRLRLVVEQASRRPCLTDPTNIVDRRRIELAQTSDRLLLAGDRVQERFAADLEQIAPRLAASTSGFARKRHELDLAASRMRATGAQMLSAPMAGLGRAAAALDALSPLKVLGRGYSIAYDGAGAVATHASSFAEGDALRVRMADGDVFGTVTSVQTSGAASSEDA
ncbi:MAG: exodeoxyribonuclease VII large subunit [Coriobacteriaceae bacterium]|nr:exodeoxyribonuclease VII large subunit [Coriobacteriaceae bacterium]